MNTCETFPSSTLLFPSPENMPLPPNSDEYEINENVNPCFRIAYSEKPSDTISSSGNFIETSYQLNDQTGCFELRVSVKENICCNIPEEESFTSETKKGEKSEDEAFGKTLLRTYGN